MTDDELRELGEAHYEGRIKPWDGPSYLSKSCHECGEDWPCVIARLTAAVREARTERWFPIMASKESKPHPMRVPWSVAELAYSKYAARYGTDQSLERLAERGGFYASEMDEHLPDWRDRCADRDRLAAELSAVKRQHELALNEVSRLGLERVEREGIDAKSEARRLAVELERVKAEVERMRAVVEAALKFARRWDEIGPQSPVHEIRALREALAALAALTSEGANRWLTLLTTLRGSCGR